MKTLLNGLKRSIKRRSFMKKGLTAAGGAATVGSGLQTTVFVARASRSTTALISSAGLGCWGEAPLLSAHDYEPEHRHHFSQHNRLGDGIDRVLVRWEQEAGKA